MTPPKKTNKPKRWVLLWLWRIQQPAAIFGVVMNAVNMALLLNLYMKWRFDNPYTGLFLTFTVTIGLLIVLAWLWDTKARMWHEQMEVSVQKNPFNFHKMTAKEVVVYQKTWIPLMQQFGMKEEAAFWVRWCDEQMVLDAQLKKEVEEILEWRKG